MEVPNKDYNPSISVDKGLEDAGTTTLAGAVVTIVSAGTALANGAPVEQVVTGVVIGALATIGSAIVQGIKRWKRNRRKHRTVSIASPYDIGSVILCLVAASFVFSGCITTELADGTIIRQLDTVALKEAYTIAAQERDRYNRNNPSPESAPPIEVNVDGVTVDVDAITAELQRRGINVRPLTKP